MNVPILIRARFQKSRAKNLSTRIAIAAFSEFSNRRFKRARIRMSTFISVPPCARLQPNRTKNPGARIAMAAFSEFSNRRFKRARIRMSTFISVPPCARLQPNRTKNPGALIAMAAFSEFSNRRFKRARIRMSTFISVPPVNPKCGRPIRRFRECRVLSSLSLDFESCSISIRLGSLPSLVSRGSRDNSRLFR